MHNTVFLAVLVDPCERGPCCRLYAKPFKNVKEKLSSN